MKIVVVGGAGAMGGVWASRLAAAGEEVAILDVSPAALVAINDEGLRVEGKDGGVTTTRLLATDDATAIGPADAVIFFTKAHHTRAAAEGAKPLVGPETTVVSLQNGWGNSDLLAEFYPPERLMMGVTYHSALVRGPGRIAHTADGGPTFLGPYDEGAGLARASAVATAMTGAGIATTVTADAKTEVWKKLVLNCAALPVAALTRLPTGELGKPGPTRDLVDGLAREAIAVAIGLGYAIDPEERVGSIHDLLAKGGEGRASMLQDVEGERKTEVEVVNGAVLREGERLGLDVPLNRAMVALIGGLERSWRRAEEA